MTRALAEPLKTKRVRASETAIRAALKAIQDAGLPVGKVCINGGQVEIHCSPVGKTDDGRNNEGLEAW